MANKSSKLLDELYDIIRSMLDQGVSRYNIANALEITEMDINWIIGRIRAEKS